MSTFETTTPATTAGDTGGVVEPVSAPPSGGDGVAVDPPAGAPVVTEGSPAPQYIDLDAYGSHLVKQKVGGAEVERPLSEVIKSDMLQADYTRKTQELADAQRRLGQADALVSALESNPADTMRQLAEAYDLDPANGFAAVERAPEEQRVVELQRQQAALNEQLQMQRIQSELAAIRSIQPDVDVQALAAYAQENQVALPVAHRLMKAEALEKAQQAQQANEAARAAAANAQVVHAGGGAAAGAVHQPSTPVNSVAEAWQRAKAALNK